MSTARILNQRRQRAIAIARAVKELFRGSERRQRRLWRDLFLADDQITVRRVGDIALADLAKFCFANETTFDPNSLIAARRDGRRDVWLRISRYLNLDEAYVQKLMEIDDGNE